MFFLHLLIWSCVFFLLLMWCMLVCKALQSRLTLCDPMYHSLVSQLVKNPPAVHETCIQSLGQEDPPEKGMATHSSILAWKIPWTEEPRWQSMGSQRVRHGWETKHACTAACQAPLSMGFSRQEYWSGLPCPPPGDLPDPGIKPASLMSPALAGEFFTTSATWEALWITLIYFWMSNPPCRPGINLCSW